MSHVSELAGKLSSHFIGWSSKGHSSTYDSEQDFHEAGIAAHVELEQEESAEQSDESAASSGSRHDSEHNFCEHAQIGAARQDNVSPQPKSSKTHARSNPHNLGGCMNLISKAAFSNKATCKHLTLVQHNFR